jgi:hypothetical protein
MSQSRPALLVKAAFVLLGLAASLAAQQPPESDPVVLMRADTQRRADWATEWLNSEDPLRVAWGAWLARRDHQTALAPLLNEKVKEYQLAGNFAPQGLEHDRHDALLAVLDALIGLDAAVPVSEAHRLYPEFPAQSLILLVRSRNAQPALLDIFQNAKGNWYWLAAGNVLARSRTPGFASILLSKFAQHLAVSVVNQGMVGGGSAGGGSECGNLAAPPKPGWPLVGEYQITQFPERMPAPTATLLASGETAVYYLRVESGRYSRYGYSPDDDPGSCDDGNRDEYRAQYLTRLMRFSFPRITLAAYPPEVTIVWDGATAYKQQLIAEVEKQRTEFRRAVTVLQESEHALTTAEAATLKLRLEIVIHDWRADRSAPLPTVLEDDGTVAVRTAFTKPLY